MDKRSKERLKRATKRSRSLAEEEKERSSSNADGGRSRGRMIGTLDDGPPAMAAYQDLSKAETDSIDKRLNVLDELLNTERDYLSDLQAVVDMYIEPMRNGRSPSPAHPMPMERVTPRGRQRGREV